MITFHDLRAHHQMEVEGGVTETDRDINQKKKFQDIKCSDQTIQKRQIGDAQCKLVLLVMNGLY